MPKDLAALLVEDGAVPADVVERAVARQQEVGGTLDTALLELDALPEDVLASYLARAAELPPAPPAAWKAADPRARRVFPSRVAERHGLAPFALDGRELSLVATYPVDLGLLDEISFMLSLHLTAHVGPEWRVRELIHRIYGSPLAPRLADIAERVQGGVGEPSPAEPPGPQAQDSEPLVRAELVAELEPAPAPPPTPTPTPARAAPGERRAPPPTPGFGGFGSDDEPMEPLAAALAEALESVDFPDFEDEAPAPQPQGASADAGDEVVPDEEVASEAPEPEEPRPPADRTAPPHWSLDDARVAVAASQHRDEVVLAALRYARDFFDFAAMFAVTRDAVAGHDALGIEEARERVRSVAIWADDPGVFKTVIETQSPYLGPAQAGAAGTDAVLRGLGRDPRTVLVYPIVLRARPVCILYADNGEAPVSARRLGDLLLFLSGIGAAFERIIRDRKKRRRRSPSAPRTAAAPPPPASAAELAVAVPPPPAPAPAEEPLPVVDAVEEAPPGAAPAPAPGPLEAAALPPEPEEEPAAPAPPPAEEEGELSFAKLEAAGDVEPEPAPAPPSPARRAPQPTDPGRTAILWPAVQAPPAGVPDGAAEADPWAAAQEAARSSSPAPAAPPAAAAESLGVLEDRFFSGGDEPGAAPAEAPAPAAERPAARAPAAAASPAAEPAATRPIAEPHAAADKPEERAPRARPVEPKGPPPVAAPPDVASLAGLADRALDADADAASAACAALGNRRRDPAVRPAAEKLRRALLSGLASRAERAARALGALRDQDAIPLLIQVLETSDPETAKAAADALAAITLQRLGPDARRWLAWWKENRGRGRAEWLFSALTSPDRELRVAASLELSHAAPPPVAYTADMPAPDREKAARAWAGWWSRSGHVL